MVKRIVEPPLVLIRLLQECCQIGPGEVVCWNLLLVIAGTASSSQKLPLCSLLQ